MATEQNHIWIRKNHHHQYHTSIKSKCQKCHRQSRVDLFTKVKVKEHQYPHTDGYQDHYFDPSDPNTETYEKRSKNTVPQSNISSNWGQNDLNYGKYCQKFVKCFANSSPFLLISLLLCQITTVSSSSLTNGNSNGQYPDPSYSQILTLLSHHHQTNDTLTKLRLHKLISAHLLSLTQQIDQLSPHPLQYGSECSSIPSELARHDLTNLIAQVSQRPTSDLLKNISQLHQSILASGKPMCDYSQGLACTLTNKTEGSLSTCECYTGFRHEDIKYSPIREGGFCKLDEMSRCYSPSYLVSRGANVIQCISGARCVGDLSGRRCISPLFSENCHCQKPCPDGSFSNLEDELRKCLRKLEDISTLGYGDECSPLMQVERDQVVLVMEKGSENAGEVIRSIKNMLKREKPLCSKEDQLVCSDEGRCVCGPEKDGLKYEVTEVTEVNEGTNGTWSGCLWAKGSRCFPEEVYLNSTGSKFGNGTCREGTKCMVEGEERDCDPDMGEWCYCQDPDDLGSSMVLGVVVVLLLVGVVGILGFAVATKRISLGSSPANV